MNLMSRLLANCIVPVAVLFCSALPASAQIYDSANHQRGVQAYELRNYALAIHLLYPFARQGDPQAEFMVGNILADGLGTPRNEPLGLDYIMKSAAHGYPNAQAAMGIRYAMGRGVRQDNCKALDMFQKAYAQDPKLVANEMGNMYKDGLCVPRDLEKARQYYNGSVQPEAAQNLQNLQYESTPEAKAQIDRATALENQKLYGQAERLLVPLATAGNRQAQDHLGYCYWVGGRTAQDLAQAARWWKAAAGQQSGYAEAMLGGMYELGLGVPKDEKKAFALYQSSAGKMSGAGYFYLARAYEFGIGTTKNRDTAVRYYTKAGQQGDDAGTHFAEFLKNPANKDFRTEAEYEAELRKDAEARKRAAVNAPCRPQLVMTIGAGGESSMHWSNDIFHVNPYVASSLCRPQ